MMLLNDDAERHDKDKDTLPCFHAQEKTALRRARCVRGRFPHYMRKAMFKGARGA